MCLKYLFSKFAFVSFTFEICKVNDLKDKYPNFEVGLKCIIMVL